MEESQVEETWSLQTDEDLALAGEIGSAIEQRLPRLRCSSTVRLNTSHVQSSRRLSMTQISQFAAQGA